MMWLPTRLYESLPALYLAIGALLLLGAAYIGVGHGLMPGYVALGTTCLLASMYVTYLRHRARSSAEEVSAQR